MSGSKTFAVIGGGKMGEAILSGWLSSAADPASAITADAVCVVEPDGQRRAFMEEAYGVACVPDVQRIDACDVAVLAVKPQVLVGVLDEMSRLAVFLPSEERPRVPLFVSIAAGVTTDRIARHLPAGSPVIRVMPNMPLQVGAGASGVCKGQAATHEQLDYVARLFGCLGRAVIVEEGQMDAVCALSGSGPGYVACLIEALRDAGAAQGLDVALAESLAVQTVLGTAQLIDETGARPEDVREAVCSPGGTTLAGLAAMDEAGFVDAIEAGVAAAAVRSRELAECS